MANPRPPHFWKCGGKPFATPSKWSTPGHGWSHRDPWSNGQRCLSVCILIRVRAVLTRDRPSLTMTSPKSTKRPPLPRPGALFLSGGDCCDGENEASVQQVLLSPSEALPFRSVSRAANPRSAHLSFSPLFSSLLVLDFFWSLSLPLFIVNSWCESACDAIWCYSCALLFSLFFPSSSFLWIFKLDCLVYFARIENHGHQIEGYASRSSPFRTCCAWLYVIFYFLFLTRTPNKFLVDKGTKRKKRSEFEWQGFPFFVGRRQGHRANQNSSRGGAGLGRGWWRYARSGICRRRGIYWSLSLRLSDLLVPSSSVFSPFATIMQKKICSPSSVDAALGMICGFGFRKVYMFYF